MRIILFLAFMIFFVGCDQQNQSSPLLPISNNTKVNPSPPKSEVQWTDLDSVSFPFFGRNVGVTVFETTDSLSACQRAALAIFQSEERKIGPQIRDSIFNWYKNGYEYMLTGARLGGIQNDAQLEEWLPKPTTPEALLKYYYPSVLYITDSRSCKDTIYGIEFESTWDVENGLGVMIENGKVVRVGFADVAWPE